MRPRRTLSEADRLTHAHTKKAIDHLFDGPWITLYQSEKYVNGSAVQFCALISKKWVTEALKQRGWDLKIGFGMPGYVSYSGRVRYKRFSETGIEPLVIIRDFMGLKPRVIELSEELRHFLSLYQEANGGRFVRIDENGDDEVVAELTDNLVRIRKPALNEFLKAKQMCLALYFEFDEYFSPGSNPIPENEQAEEVCSKDRIWGRCCSSGIMGNDSVSRLMGKRILEPPKRSGPNEIWKSVLVCEDFIIGFDDGGNSRLHNSNPDHLADNFGGNKGAPHFLTPVHFRRDVLDKYYADPGRFSVEDGHLRCRGLWRIRLDNHRSDRVIAFLGDLGRDLPHREQLHWKSHNIPPEGGLSETAFRRQILGQFCVSSSPEHEFKSQFELFQEGWLNKYDWYLFRPLRDEDSHVLKRIHIPSGDRVPEFEAQILGLTKLLIDSLNVEKLEVIVGGRLDNETGLALFERALKSDNYPHTQRDIKTLRDLQSLRSQGVAHRKGKNYLDLAKRLGIEQRSFPEIIEDFLSNLIQMLDDLAKHRGL